MNKFLLSSKAKIDLIKIARYSQLTWGIPQRNDYLKVLDSTFQLLANEPESGLNCDYIREGYSKYSQASHVIYYKKYKNNQIFIVRILHKSMDVNTALKKNITSL
ncbi:type II toxin-antitoxin system RelE/ParE family toxin [Colwellia sp. M166]|uniref:type II toxin-antitoxin system RelE/ParE family toxin n=1 Tax=Colwellia sp. M166 TaxID=2583805 RepID=UPI00211E6FF6|nr:type II toxin-antitoxin system RelE/ParE family toxin [Colwellia sp. M166]UUO22445.1 type II toxin-antitoxin system RelE/ParE family toxin [Colwellia sp. M166]|tara:strand:- start:301 stop:615 length:315 start_codon:yes stop_codon:yes gene_type:complete